jgi:hypothetical protein
MNHEYTIPTMKSNEEHTLSSHPNRLVEFGERHGMKIAITLGLAATAIAAATSMNYLRGGNDDPSKFEKNEAVEKVVFDEGARLRNDPFVGDEPPLTTLDHVTEISTPGGVWTHAEFHNGNWVGVDKNSVPGLESYPDNDGIVWVNEQKVSSSADSAE